MYEWPVVVPQVSPKYDIFHGPRLGLGSGFTKPQQNISVSLFLADKRISGLMELNATSANVKMTFLCRSWSAVSLYFILISKELQHGQCKLFQKEKLYQNCGWAGTRPLFPLPAVIY